MEDSAKDYSSSDLNDDATAPKESVSKDASQLAGTAQGAAEDDMDGVDEMDGMDEMEQIVEEDEATGRQQMTQEDQGRKSGNPAGAAPPNRQND